MTRTLLLTIVAGLLLATAATAAGFPEPQRASFTQAQYDAALKLARDNPLPPGTDWEDNQFQMKGLDPSGAWVRPQEVALYNEDDDGAHYGRGHTLVIHIFVNDPGGAWTGTEMGDAGARAAVAKNFYAGAAPWAAALDFDHPGTNDYWYYNVTLAYTVPVSGMTDAVMEDVVAAIGMADGDGDGTRVDDLTTMLQNWGGGWDNVLACFEPHITGRAWASYGTSKTALYMNSDGNVFAHEWGHLFGACDEYVEGGHCNSSIDCGPCQSWYLDGQVNNSNCQLVACPSHVSCIMIDNTFSNVCDYTRDEWAWVDADSDGWIDQVKTRTTGSNFITLWEVPHNTWFVWNNTTDRMWYAPRSQSWAVTGVRSPSTADYDLYLYGENNFNFELAHSAYGGATVDFVVGDYNHSPNSVEHAKLVHYSGDAATYDLTWEQGTQVLYPDGLLRTENWTDYNLVRVWDVPLFGGEEVTFSLSNPGGGVDFGMALYKSNGAAYWAGRSAAVASADANGVGAGESFTYTVPTYDVYGLVVWANTTVAGQVSIRIGPAPATLADATPFYSALDLRLFDFDDTWSYWAFVGTRPDPGTGAALAVFDDVNYTDLRALSADFGDGGMEFVAADYNHAANPDYLRVIKDLGAGNHRTEWEGGADIISGAVDGSWVSPHLGKMWDAWLGGKTYFLREYHSAATPFESGLYLFRSDDGDYYKERINAQMTQDSRAANVGGEWGGVVGPADPDWCGIVLTALDGASAGPYSLWMGWYVYLTEAARVPVTDEIAFSICDVTTGYWSVFGARSDAADPVSVWLYGDGGYTIDYLYASDQSNPDVRYVVGDWNHNATGQFYPRFRRNSGVSGYTAQWEGGSEQFSFPAGGHNVYNLNWTAGDVVQVRDIYVPFNKTIGILVEDLSGQMDLGAELFKSSGATYYGRRGQGVDFSDAGGVGGSEELLYTTPGSDWLGLVIFNKNGNGGSYRVHIVDQGVVGVDGSGIAEFGLRGGPNPFVDRTALTFSLAREGQAELAIYDLQGREVRHLAGGGFTAGPHKTSWDGRDEAGHPVSAGIYLARLRSGGEERTLKLIRAR